ncbi:hypothetical protein CGH02_14190 [Vibrio parahaemolyticus]|uniref:hypothetical protein n=1 Tax=Vibrio parahaemolyticus TaxID=670 RepID=UPI0011711624|nr:hypothetical protein [Vibrio parahaemolyticus]EGS6497690.1 hypothetical protein [Vibrio parahaemolyticus]ELF4875966.1 hypothetical protein [Vibrio parahaemolyticus]TOE11201.1 hypothetical protein CGJ50_14010 [Vibrio parahaemolyticus]TOI03908.1 hypothetical protein CGI69_10570 [Vibrio parahaemolyticus]TOI99100.1 hypothetical protein CGI48_20745 [Vibrio parahaemolyticus]
MVRKVTSIFQTKDINFAALMLSISDTLLSRGLAIEKRLESICGHTHYEGLTKTILNVASQSLDWQLRQ